MSWLLLFGLTLALGIAVLAQFARRAELKRMRGAVERRERAARNGGAKAQLQHPVVDLSRCLGCGTCVAACPEEGVLELVHGQAMVVKGARCQGVSACERECPVGAITVTIENLKDRTDVPAVSEDLEAVGAPGVFLAGEVTAHALIKTAIEHGAAVGSEVARRVEAKPAARNGVLDLVVVGAGPAGIACSLEAKRNELSFVTIDQEETAGGTVAKYPRRKLVMTQPVDMPLYGRFKNTTYTKEELVDLWRGIVDGQDLPLRGGETFEGLEPDGKGNYLVRTKDRTYVASHVCLALGRRGSPRKLGVPGEELPKVAYSLLDARSYTGRRILVVGGGDSAVEAALGLAKQPGNEVALSYRKESLFRVHARNEKRVEECVRQGKLRVLFESEVRAIRPDAVDLAVRNGRGDETVTLANDDVFILAGGVPPFELLSRSGVSFDPSLRDAPEPLLEQGTGLGRALKVGFGLSVAALLWAVWHADYYLLAPTERPTHVKHPWLRPGMGAGLWLGIAATAMIAVNLLYVLRRAPRFKLRFGSLQAWMTSHVATGILAFLCAVLHAAMSAGNSVGGHAFLALAVLIVTGAVGRYFYAWVPRAANGRELELAEVKARLGRMSEEWDQGQRRFRERARDAIAALVEEKQWRASLPGRALALLGVQRDLNRVLRELAREGRREGVAEHDVRETIQLARRAHRTALMAAHYEDLRAVLSSWRYLHRWVAALLVLLVILHVAYSLAYGAFFDGGVG